MSPTVIFGVGIVVFAFTVWGSCMAGGIWLGHIAEAEDEAEDERSRPVPDSTGPSIGEVGGTPRELPDN